MARPEVGGTTQTFCPWRQTKRATSPPWHASALHPQFPPKRHLRRAVQHEKTGSTISNVEPKAHTHRAPLIVRLFSCSSTVKRNSSQSRTQSTHASRAGCLSNLFSRLFNEKQNSQEPIGHVFPCVHSMNNTSCKKPSFLFSASLNENNF